MGETKSSGLGYEFRDPAWLELACIHKSFGNEQRAEIPIERRDNERLEFLGDAVLDLAISRVLLETFPDATEGDLSKMRAGLVNERSLAGMARALGLGSRILLGKGEEQTGGRDKDSILASTFEAVVAAVFSDGGYAAADAWLRALFGQRIGAIRGDWGLQDHKTHIQEVIQARHKTAPRYELVGTSGPDHDKTFEVRLLVNGQVLATATGKSKKEAEQNAAKVALAEIG